MILNYTSKGEGDLIVFLHGMALSHRYWDEYITKLSAKRHVIALDLLGFGYSPQSKNGYSAEDHVNAIKETIDSLELGTSFTLVGHSMGALIALKYSRKYSQDIKKLVLIGMPIFKNPDEARASITKSKKVLELAYYGQSSKLLCNLWCQTLRPISRLIAPLYLYRLPKSVARESVLHSWQSYSKSMTYIIENQTVEKDLRKITVPTQLIYGNKDSQIALYNLKTMKKLGKNIKITIMTGTHNLPLEKYDKVSELILT